ncbi:respiratory nitrate reductase subunit gamma [Pectobacterium zantedeschiae]|uniref:nitrate reductase (quinone) n=1 Tax=Pectobacterium zantedeschiae TaxID=2034769 RepID=A0A9X8JKW5_9GAMM|nr:respiratory nitrate reductase subunit gamma [Pectobacterium zantedeschiae]RYC48587.1 respiratory nitrate reductase subunit gamma [Pectobacterium zantedeschiae]
MSAFTNSSFINFSNVFFFDIYPYMAMAIFLIGSWLRYDYGQYSWRAGSSQMLDKKGMRLASNLFHLGILGVFAGHFLGMLTPHWMYEAFLPMDVKQKMAMFGGGAAGLLTFVGGVLLLKRRLTNPRIRATSSVGDILILSLLVIQAGLGVLTIPFSAQHMDGSEMLKLVGWAQSVAYFQGGASAHLVGVALIFKLHIVLGLTLFVLFPFCRLVHIWSAPVEYLTRRYQLVRNRR